MVEESNYEKAIYLAEKAGFYMLGRQKEPRYGVKRAAILLSSGGLLKIEEDEEGYVRFEFLDRITLREVR